MSYSRISSIAFQCLGLILTLLLGVVAPAYAGPPTVAQATIAQPTAPTVQPAPVDQIYFIAYRAHGQPSGVLFFVVLRGHPHSAVATLVAYYGTIR